MARYALTLIKWVRRAPSAVRRRFADERRAKLHSLRTRTAPLSSDLPIRSRPGMNPSRHSSDEKGDLTCIFWTTACIFWTTIRVARRRSAESDAWSHCPGRL